MTTLLIGAGLLVSHEVVNCSVCFAQCIVVRFYSEIMVIGIHQTLIEEINYFPLREKHYITHIIGNVQLHLLHIVLYMIAWVFNLQNIKYT